MSIADKRDRSLAEAVAILVETIHRSFPTVSTHPIPPYEDEDFALEVMIPGNMDRNEVMNACIQHAVDIENKFGFAILTRVKKEEGGIAAGAGGVAVGGDVQGGITLGA